MMAIGYALGRLGLVAALSGSVFAAPAVAAHASCDSPDEYYRILGNHKSFMPAGSVLHDGPGGTMAVSVTQSTTLTSTKGGVLGGGYDGLFWKAKAEVNKSISKAVAVTQGHTYTREISAGKYGNAQYGSTSYRVDWQLLKTTTDCDAKVLDHGTATFPTVKLGWEYYETNN